MFQHNVEQGETLFPGSGGVIRKRIVRKDLTIATIMGGGIEGDEREE